MKALLRKVFSPILSIFEKGDGPYAYKPLDRTILLALGGFFSLFTGALIFVGITFSQVGALIPGAIFFAVSLTCIVVGSLGTDRAVSKIWGSK